MLNSCFSCLLIQLYKVTHKYSMRFLHSVLWWMKPVTKNTVRTQIWTHTSIWRPEVPLPRKESHLESGALDHSATLTTVGVRSPQSVWIWKLALMTAKTCFIGSVGHTSFKPLTLKNHILSKWKRLLIWRRKACYKQENLQAIIHNPKERRIAETSLLAGGCRQMNKTWQIKLSHKE